MKPHLFPKNFQCTDSEVAKLELVVNKKRCGQSSTYYFGAGQNLNPGDGIIYVSDVNQIYRVKDGLKNGN